MIALILGGAPSVFDEAKEAAALLNRRHIVVAANLAGIEWPGRLDGWVTLHPEHLSDWRAQRKGPAAHRHFTPGGAQAPKWADIAAERWPGSSGLYATQCALFEMGATAAILCGIPMDAEAGHFTGRAQWESAGSYRQAFATALPLIGGRVRSMGGWTEQLFGRPTPEWVAAVDNITPLGVTAPQGSRFMHKVTNTGEGTQSFWARNPDGTDRRVHLSPGDSAECEINLHDPVFVGEGLKVVEVEPPAPEPTPEPSPKPTAKSRAR